MTEQPTERRADQPRPVLGITHKRHGCGIPTPICGYIDTNPKMTSYAVLTPAEQARYQDCVVCESLWSEARVVQLQCPHCGQRIRE
jgi:formate dehydrogenase maturation protein FdhE